MATVAASSFMKHFDPVNRSAQAHIDMVRSSLEFKYCSLSPFIKQSSPCIDKAEKTCKKKEQCHRE